MATARPQACAEEAIDDAEALVAATHKMLAALELGDSDALSSLLNDAALCPRNSASTAPSFAQLPPSESETSLPAPSKAVSRGSFASSMYPPNDTDTAIDAAQLSATPSVLQSSSTIIGCSRCSHNQLHSSASVDTTKSRDMRQAPSEVAHCTQRAQDADRPANGAQRTSRPSAFQSTSCIVCSPRRSSQLQSSSAVDFRDSKCSVQPRSSATSKKVSEGKLKPVCGSAAGAESSPSTSASQLAAPHRAQQPPPPGVAWLSATETTTSGVAHSPRRSSVGAHTTTMEDELEVLQLSDQPATSRTAAVVQAGAMDEKESVAERGAAVPSSLNSDDFRSSYDPLAVTRRKQRQRLEAERAAREAAGPCSPLDEFATGGPPQLSASSSSRSVVSIIDSSSLPSPVDPPVAQSASSSTKSSKKASTRPTTDADDALLDSLLDDLRR